MNKEICWNITARCNQKCKYCHRFLNIRELSISENELILENLYNSGVTHITWTGGEALIYNGIEKLIKKSYELGIKNKLITNGKLLTNKKIDELYPFLESITLSLDSIKSKTNEQLGRGSNHFQEIKRILDYITTSNYDLDICINSVVCKYNLSDFNLLTEFLNDYKIIKRWRVFKFMPLREKALINNNLFEISLDSYYKVINGIKGKATIPKIDTRIEKDMEKKYILIIANGDIIVTDNGVDKKVGNAIIDSFIEVM